jgi:RNA polymerase sigma factor (sigma-70 family)
VKARKIPHRVRVDLLAWLLALPPVSSFDAAAALAAAADGDQPAWESIVSAYSGLVWAVARAHRLSPADAADVCQGTWLRLVEHLGDIRDPARLGGWLATTARREALALLRRSSRDIPVGEADVLNEVTPGTPPALDEELIRSEELRALWEAFSRLSDSCQRLLRVLFADPSPHYGEISAALGIPVGSIGPTRARCLASLQSHLSRSAADRQRSGTGD